MLVAAEGAFINGGQILFYAIAARIYDTSVRATASVPPERSGASARSSAHTRAARFDSSGRALFLFVAVAMMLTLTAVLFISSGSMTREERAAYAGNLRSGSIPHSRLRRQHRSADPGLPQMMWSCKTSVG